MAEIKPGDKAYEIPENPSYDPVIRALKTSDPANAETVFNPLFQQIIENVHAVKVEGDGKASEETLQQVKTDVSTIKADTGVIKTNVNTLGTEISKVKTVADEINTKVGAANNTGGGTTAGTLMGKLNKIISDIAQHTANWTAARASSIDAIKADVRITSENGSNRSAANWAMLGYQNADNANKNATAASNNTATNNTADKAGNLSQKASYTHSLLENSSYGLNALKKDIWGASPVNGSYRLVGEWSAGAYQYAAYANEHAGQTNNRTSLMSSRLGTESDTITAKTVFGKLAHIIDQLGIHIGSRGDGPTDESIGKDYTVRSVHGVLYRVWANTSPAKTVDKGGSLSQRHAYTHSLLETVSTNTARGCIKSIQRGVATMYSSKSTASITISAVNPEKCIVLVNGSGHTRDFAYAITPYMGSLTATLLTVRSSQPELNYDFSWQVIEFY